MLSQHEFGGAYKTGFGFTIRFLLSKGVARDAAEEAAQEAWTRGWERISQLRKEEKLGTWVNTIALNIIRRSVRERRFREPLTDMADARGVDMAAIDLSTILNSCGASDRRLLVHQLYGLTTVEMANSVGVTESAVRVRLMRARRSARSMVTSVLSAHAA